MGMLAHTRAIVSAAAYAFVTRRKVAGIYDHLTKQDLRIAAESRGDQVQGYDGDRSAKFALTLPELYDSGDNSFVSFEVEGTKVKGYDRRSSSAYEALVTDQRVQLYDYGQSEWFTFDVREIDR